MSDQSDVFQYLLNESPDAKNADLFSFGPPPQPPDAPSPELFDQDVDQDVAELDLNLSFDDFLSTVCDNVPAASTLPALTYSTDSCYEIASSLDFYINAPSVPLMPSEIETVTCGSVNDGSYTTHGSIYSPAAVLSDGLLPFPPANTVTAQSDCGTSYVSTSIPVHVPEYEVVQVKAPSDYGGSVNDGPYTTHDSIYSPAAVLSDGLLPFPPANPVMAQSDYETSYVSTSLPVHLPESDVVQVKAQSDYVTSYVSTSIPVHVLDSEAAQVKAQSGYGTPDVSISPPVHVPSSKVAQTAKNKRFKCTECSYTSPRKYNTEKHIQTHFRIKPFGCDICGRRFTRNNDLKRHCENLKIHGKAMSSSSVSRVSNHRFDPMSGRPQHRSSIRRDERLT